jgi:hypothetical protein
MKGRLFPKGISPKQEEKRCDPSLIYCSILAYKTVSRFEFDYNFHKPNAFYGPPFSSVKKFALTSLSVRGTLRKQIVNKSSSTIGNTTTTTTTTKTWQFPQLSNAFWDQLLENIHSDITSLLKDRYGIGLIPVELVVRAPTYAELQPISDENTTVEIERTYKGTKSLIPTSFSALVGAISSTFASDRPDSRLMNELEVDGLISITLDLDLCRPIPTRSRCGRS